MPDAPRTRRRDDREYRFSCEVADYLARVLSPDLPWSHFPAGEKRTAAAGARLKRMGLRPGWPDYLVWHKGDLIAIELKVDRNGQTESQREVADQLTRHGATYAVARTLDEVEAILLAAEVPLRFRLEGRP